MKSNENIQVFSEVIVYNKDNEAQPSFLLSDECSEAGDVAFDYTEEFKVDERVWLNGTKPGYIRFIGKTQFAPGIWIGVVLDDPVGKNNGSVSGVTYFECEPLRGLFVRPSKLSRTPDAITGIGDSTVEMTSSNFLMPCSKGSEDITFDPCSKLKLDEPVMVITATGMKNGTLRFVGKTDFAKGLWAGIELDVPYGKNDGSVAGKRYFKCLMKHGLFAPLHKVCRQQSTISIPALVNGPLLRSNRKDSSYNSVGNSFISDQEKLNTTTFSKSQFLQDALKKHVMRIEQLLKEQYVGRSEFPSISTHIQEAECRSDSLHELRKVDNVASNLEEEITSLKRISEDILFLLDEEKEMKCELEKVTFELVTLKNHFAEANQKHEDVQRKLMADVQEKNDTIYSLESELDCYILKVNELVVNNKDLNELIIMKENLDIVEELGEKINLLNEDLKSKTLELAYLMEENKVTDTIISNLKRQLEIKTSSELQLQNEFAELNAIFLQKSSELEKMVEVQRSLSDSLVVLKCQVKLDAIVKEKLESQLKESKEKCEENFKKFTNIQAEKQALEKQLKDALQERDEVLHLEELFEKSNEEKLPEHFKILLKSLEGENQLLKNEIAALKLSEENLALSLKNAANETFEDRKDKELFLTQIDFLNSIISNLRQANKELSKLQKSWDKNDILNEILEPTPLRLFCDICNIFDLHDTCSCPRQESHVKEEAVCSEKAGTKELDEML